MELNFKTLASAYLNVLEGYDFIIPEDVPANERTAFHGAAAAAHKSGNFMSSPAIIKNGIARSVKESTPTNALVTILLIGNVSLKKSVAIVAKPRAKAIGIFIKSKTKKVTKRTDSISQKSSASCVVTVI